MGFPAVKQVQYIWFTDLDDEFWRNASHHPDAPGEFRMHLEAAAPGSILLRLRTCNALDVCLENEDSPFLVSVRASATPYQIAASDAAVDLSTAMQTRLVMWLARGNLQVLLCKAVGEARQQRVFHGTSSSKSAYCCRVRTWVCISQATSKACVRTRVALCTRRRQKPGSSLPTNLHRGCVV